MMLREYLVIRLVLIITTIFVSARPSLAATAPPEKDETFLQAYYLEHGAHDYAAAKRLYGQVLEGHPAAEVRSEAQYGFNRCRDALVADNFASLMPDDAMAYIEIRRPGELVAGLAGMLGLANPDMQAALAARPVVESSMPFHIPQEIVISPALFASLESFGGIAAAVTEIHPNGPPEGVFVLHHGDMPLLKGLLETGFQFAPTAAKIHDLPTFGSNIEGANICGVLTESLFIAGSRRDLVESAVGRLVGSVEGSLASRADLVDTAKRRAGAAIFAYVDLQRMVKFARSQMGERDRRDMDQVDQFVDLSSLQWATLSCGIRDSVLGAELSIRLKEDHHNLVFNLLRLPAASRAGLARVPENAAAFFCLGLNPAWSAAGMRGGTDGAAPAVSAMDVGREFFGNLRELCVFAMPGAVEVNAGGHSNSIPNVGIILNVNDLEKSKALWSQVLKLVTVAAGQESGAPEQIELGASTASAYRVPELGRIFMAEQGDCLMFGLTRPAMKAALETAGGGKSVLDDPAMRRAIDGMPADSCIMAAAHVGRLATLAGEMAPAFTHDTGEVMAMRMGTSQGSEFCRDMVAWGAVGQSANQLTFRAALQGLPNVNDVLKRFGPMINAASGMSRPSPARPSPDAQRRRARRPRPRPEQPDSKRDDSHELR